MKITVFGMGYVGCVTSACLAENGHTVIGVDIDAGKVDLINNKQPTVIEKDLDKLIGEAVTDGRLRATLSVTEAIQATDISLICVGTPSAPSGYLDTQYVERVCEQIGEIIAQKETKHTIVLRSTVLPGTTVNIVQGILEKTSGKTAGKDFGLAFNPEFLREGTAVKDFFNPPKTVIGAVTEETAKLVADLYAGIEAPLHITTIAIAEMVKYADNAFHAVKVSFANEIGAISKKLDIDGQAVMDIFCTDTKLNISTAYLRPGYAFGGSCLPKDLRALTYLARTQDLNVPMLNSILPSNEAHWQRGLDMITVAGIRPVGFLGFSFKAGTDDLRESPILALIERLIGKGYPIRIYDRNVNLARLTGANKTYLENSIPHIAKLLCQDPQEVLDFAKVIVVGNGAPEFAPLLQPLNRSKQIIDLVRIFEELPQHNNYQGIGW